MQLAGVSKKPIAIGFSTAQVREFPVWLCGSATAIIGIAVIVSRPVAVPTWTGRARACQEQLGVTQLVVWQRRSGQPPHTIALPGTRPRARLGSGNGPDFQADAHHRGQDPHLFLDLRCARRYLRHHCQKARVLNLFSYTCAAGIAAEAGGASQVMQRGFFPGCSAPR